MWEFLQSLVDKFEPTSFVDHLVYMGIGMLGILLVIGVIILLTYTVNAVGLWLEKKKKDNE